MRLIKRTVTLRRVWLAAAVAVLAALSLMLGSSPASADDTVIYFSFPVDPATGQSATDCGDPMSPPPMQSRVILVPNGPSQIACVWAANVSDPLGVAAFQLDVAYGTEFFSVTTAAESTTWLLSSGRQLWSCFSGVEELVGDPLGPPNRWHFDIACTTLNPAPLGPQGGGLLATLTLQPGSVPSMPNPSFDHINSFLVSVSADALEIPATLETATVVVARCADFEPDGVVSVSDIFAVVLKFGTSDPLYDLNGDGAVGVQDINIAVLQFGMICPT